jgi:DNA-binding NarL/FixJ family response regulator
MQGLEATVATDSAHEIAIASWYRYRAESLAVALSRESSFRPRVLFLPQQGSLVGFSTVLIEADEKMEPALQLTRATVQECPGTKVILLGVRESDHNVLQIAESGASGYASPSSSVQELAGIIAAVDRGEFTCSPPIAFALFKRLADLASTKALLPPEGTVLTSRERRVLELMSQNCSNKEIAARLFLSTYTVKNHVHRILKKLQVQNRRNLFRHLCSFNEESQIGFR